MVAVVVAIFMTVLLGLAALALDMGHLMVVRNELQNAADAAALTGASSLYPRTPPASPHPDWVRAATEATSAISMNKSDGTTLADCEVETGYWNLGHTPFGLQGEATTPGPLDFAAVQVTASRSAGHNGGPLQHWFAPAIGIHYPTSEAGQWTSFQFDSNSVPTIRDLIANGNPTPLSVGDDIWIQPGTKTTLYSSVQIGAEVLLPIVQNADTHAFVPVIGFIGFHITASVGGSGKYIERYFLPSFYARNTGGVGPAYGAYSHPVLVQ
jgi:hypothetical protein